MPTRQLRAFLVALTGILLLSACWPGPDATPAPPASTSIMAQPGSTTTSDVKRRIQATIGFALDNSGAGKTMGDSQKAAIQLAVGEINALAGPQVNAIFEDTGGNPDEALAVFQKFVQNDEVDLIIGPTFSSEALKADPLAQQNKVPVLAISNTAGGVTDIGDYIFRVSMDQSQVIREVVEQAKDKLKVSKVSLLYDKDDTYSKAEMDVFRSEFQKNGIKISSEQTFSASDMDYEAALRAIKNENPDAIVVSALSNTAPSVLQQARNDVGISPRTYIIGGNGFNSPDVVKKAGQASEGLVVGTVWSADSADEINKKFVAAYTKVNGKPPDQFAAQAYAGVYVAYDAIKRADVEGKSLGDARAAIRDVLTRTDKVPTVLGLFSFTDKNDADYALIVQIVRDGKFEVIK